MTGRPIGRLKKANLSGGKRWNEEKWSRDDQSAVTDFQLTHYATLPFMIITQWRESPINQTDN